MIAVDTSVVVAAFASWHDHHSEAIRIVAAKPELPGPVALEAYAVLTRLPPPHRAEGPIVRDFLVRAFRRTLLVLDAGGASRLVAQLVELGIVGGASYDAVIALIARQHGCELATLDHRALQTYERVGVSVLRLA